MFIRYDKSILLDSSNIIVLNKFLRYLKTQGFRNGITNRGKLPEITF